MAHLFPCPACGHKHRVSDNLVGRKVKCTACDAVFRLSPGQALAEPPPAAKAAEAGWGTRLLHKVMDDPSAALDGAIAGAIGGVLAGVVVAVPAGIVSGEAAGETVVRVLLGFVLGIGLGTLLGGLQVAAGRRLWPGYVIRPGFALLVGGGLIGGLVALLVGEGRWVPLGVGLGAVGAQLWALLCREVESVANRTHHLTLDEESLDGEDEGTDRRHPRQTDARSSEA